MQPLHPDLFTAAAALAAVVSAAPAIRRRMPRLGALGAWHQLSPWLARRNHRAWLVYDRLDGCRVLLGWRATYAAAWCALWGRVLADPPRRMEHPRRAVLRGMWGTRPTADPGLARMSTVAVHLLLAYGVDYVDDHQPRAITMADLVVHFYQRQIAPLDYNLDAELGAAIAAAGARRRAAEGVPHA